jgi:hypothetical protein
MGFVSRLRLESRHRNQGESVSNAERRAKTTSESRVGFLAVLSDLPRDGGSGAGFWGGRTALLRLVGLTVLAIAAFLALTAGSASAATVRPFESQITEADGTALTDPTGLAVDSADNLWVSDPGLSSIDKFDSLGASV